jgi:fluoride exporter
MLAYLWITVGSALGGMLRYGISGFVARRVGETFPWGTLAVNVSGSFVIGLAAALTASGGAFDGNITIRQFVMIGICGGYTTFSSFSLQTLNLARDREWSRVVLNIVASVGLCVLAVWAGFAVGAFALGG